MPRSSYQFCDALAGNCTSTVKPKHSGSCAISRAGRLSGAARGAGLHKSFSQQLGAVAVLSPYRAQLATLRRSFQRCGAPAAALADVTFATVDGFQVGRQLTESTAVHPLRRRLVSLCAHLHTRIASTVATRITYLPAISAKKAFVSSIYSAHSRQVE